MAWDIRGCRPLDDLKAEIALWGNTMVDYRPNEMLNEEHLQVYVGCWGKDANGYIDRPLEAYTNKDVAETLQVAKRSLAYLPGFPDSPTSASKADKRIRQTPAL